MIAPATRVSAFLAVTRTTGVSDAELLDRFVTERDGAAFTALVDRHGAMVFGLCRRVVRDWHLAEDAFQATFLVLAQKAATVSPPGAVAGWLHAVASRVSLSARRTALRRAGRERQTGDGFEPATGTPPDTDLKDAIDGEVQKAPREVSRPDRRVRPGGARSPVRCHCARHSGGHPLESAHRRPEDARGAAGSPRGRGGGRGNGRRPRTAAGGV